MQCIKVGLFIVKSELLDNQTKENKVFLKLGIISHCFKYHIYADDTELYSSTPISLPLSTLLSLLST